MMLVDITNNTYIKNGCYVPFVYLGLWYFTGNFYLSSIISLKLHTMNYYFWFASYYTLLPGPYNFIKQFVRFTDSALIASFIYYFNPTFFPIAHNLQFLATFGYWIGMFFFNMDETNEPPPPQKINWYINLWSYLLHILPYSLLLGEIYMYDQCHNYFTSQDMIYSFNWVQYWFIYVYLPWRIISKDCMYSCLSSESPVISLFIFASSIHVIMYIGHIFGKYILYMYC